MAMIAAADLQAWHPMVQRRTSKHRTRQPDPIVNPVLVGLATQELVEMANRLSLLEMTVAALAGELGRIRADIAEMRSATDADQS